MRTRHVLTIVILLILSSVLTASAGYANYAPVPKTGQTKCYNTTGTEISCTGTGQDGEYKMGVAWPNPRFTDNNDGTVTDNLTGLIWLKNANCAGAEVDWTTAFSYVESLDNSGTMNTNGCGDTSNGGAHQIDWRLPNVRELESLIDFGRHDPALPSGHPFTGIQSDAYWSSTTYVEEATSAWEWDCADGFVGDSDKTTETRYVWPVRGESAPCPACATGGATEPFKPLTLFGPWLLLAAAVASGAITAVLLKRRAA